MDLGCLMPLWGGKKRTSKVGRGRIGQRLEKGKVQIWTHSSTSLPFITSPMCLHWIPHLKGILPSPASMIDWGGGVLHGLEQCLPDPKVNEEMTFAPNHFFLWLLLSSLVATWGSIGETIQPRCECGVSWLPLEEVTVRMLQTSLYLCVCSVV